MDAGAIVIIVVLVVAIPVGFLMSMGALAGAIGWLVGRDRDLDNVTDDGEPNEYLVLSDANPWAEAPAADEARPPYENDPPPPNIEILNAAQKEKAANEKEAKAENNAVPAHAQCRHANLHLLRVTDRAEEPARRFGELPRHRFQVIGQRLFVRDASRFRHGWPLHWSLVVKRL